MIIGIKRMWVNDPKKRMDKDGNVFWTFYTSLGKWLRGKKMGLSKGYINCVCYLKDIELTPKQELLEVVADLFYEVNKDKTRYYKMVISKYKSLSQLKEQPDIDDVQEIPTEIPEIPDEPMEVIPELDDGKEVM